MAGWDDINVLDYRIGTLDSYSVLINSGLRLIAEKEKEDELMVTYRFHLYDLAGHVLEKYAVTDIPENFRFFCSGVRDSVLDHMIGHVSKVYRLEEETDKNILAHLYLHQYPEAERISVNLPSDISVTSARVCVKCPDDTVLGVEKNIGQPGFRYILFSNPEEVIRVGDVKDLVNEDCEFSARDVIGITADRIGFTGDDKFVRVAVEDYLDDYDYWKEKADHARGIRTVKSR